MNIKVKIREGKEKEIQNKTEEKGGCGVQPSKCSRKGSPSPPRDPFAGVTWKLITAAQASRARIKGSEQEARKSTQFHSLW